MLKELRTQIANQQKKPLTKKSSPGQLMQSKSFVNRKNHRIAEDLRSLKLQSALSDMGEEALKDAQRLIGRDRWCARRPSFPVAIELRLLIRAPS